MSRFVWEDGDIRITHSDQSVEEKDKIINVNMNQSSMRRYEFKDIDDWDNEFEKAAEDYKLLNGSYPNKLLTSENSNIHIQILLLKMQGFNTEDKCVMEEEGHHVGSLQFFEFKLDCYTDTILPDNEFYLTCGAMPGFDPGPDGDGEPVPILLQKAA